MHDMEHVSQSEVYYPFPKESHYQELIGESFESAKRTVYIHKGEKYPLPAFTFNHLSRNDQLGIANILAINAKSKGFKLIYEIGYGTSLSPLDSAFSETDSVVMGFDPNGKFPEKIQSGTEDLTFPKTKTRSLAALFSLDASDLIKNGFPKASRLQCISPYPTMVQDMVYLGSKLSNRVDILPNPNMVDPKEFEEIVRSLPSHLSGKIVYLNKEELIKEIGTSKSSYVFPSAQEKVPLIKINTKI